MPSGGTDITSATSGTNPMLIGRVLARSSNSGVTANGTTQIVHTEPAGVELERNSDGSSHPSTHQVAPAITTTSERAATSRRIGETLPQWLNSHCGRGRTNSHKQEIELASARTVNCLKI